MKIDLKRHAGDWFFRDDDRVVSICYEKLVDWFDLPEDVKNITLDVSGDFDLGEESVIVYYYPSAHEGFLYDTYGLTKEGMLESLNVLCPTVAYIVQQMALPPQGVLFVTLEYEV